MTDRITVTSVVDKDALCVSEFLRSLELLDVHDVELSCLFSLPLGASPLLRRMLDGFSADHPSAGLVAGASRDDLVNMAVEAGASHVFVLEPTLLLPPPLLQHLMSLDKNIVAEVFWTQWHETLPPLPNVWISDEYAFCDTRVVGSSPELQSATATEFLSMLHQPGTIRVGGMTACTLISREVLLGGVSFKHIPNLSLWDEERHFCIRAAALGFELWADTHYPPLHLYRPTDIGRVDHFWSRWHTTAPIASEPTGLAGNCSQLGAA